MSVQDFAVNRDRFEADGWVGGLCVEFYQGVRAGFVVTPDEARRFDDWMRVAVREF